MGDVVELAAAIEPQDAAVRELELGPAPAVGPQAVAGEEGCVLRRFLGPRVIRALQRDPLLRIADPAVVVSVLLGRGSGGEAGDDDGECGTLHGEGPSQGPEMP